MDFSRIADKIAPKLKRIKLMSRDWSDRTECRTRLIITDQQTDQASDGINPHPGTNPGHTAPVEAQRILLAHPGLSLPEADSALARSREQVESLLATAPVCALQVVALVLAAPVLSVRAFVDV